MVLSNVSKPGDGDRSDKKLSQMKDCFRCGKHHSPTECRYRETICRNCSKIGHLEKMCYNKTTDKSFQNKARKPQNR